MFDALWLAASKKPCYEFDMYRWFTTLLLFFAFYSTGCTGLSPQSGFVAFKYSLWVDNLDGTFSDVGCIDAGISTIRADVFFKGLHTGSAESICGAFGNSDGASTLDELGEFLSQIDPTTFDQLQITAIREDGALAFFGLRINDDDRAPAEQQTIDFANPVTIDADQEVTLSLPGETGSQIDNELQMILLQP